MINIKKSLFVLILVFSLFFVIGTPVLELERTTIQPQETLIGKIYTTGEFKEHLTSDDIMFYSGQKREYFEHELYYYNNAYYLYVIFNKEGNFTIKTDEILYSLAGEAGAKAIEQTINVKYDNPESSTKSHLLSIEPGVVYSFSNKTSLNLINRGSSSLDVSVGEVSFTIGPFQAKTLSLNLEKPLSFVQISTYKSFSVPVIFLGAKITNNNEQNNSNQTPEIISSNLVVRTEIIEFNTTKNKTLYKEIELANLGENNITGLYIVNNLTMAIVDVPYLIPAKESKFLTLKLFSGENSRNETIILSYIENNTEFNVSIPLIINIIQNNTNQTKNNTKKELTCLDHHGMLCDGECQGKSNFTSDGYCCYGTCVPFSTNTTGQEENKPSYGWLVGLILLVLIGIVAYVIFTKYKQAQPEPPEKKLDLSKKRYENRMKGVLSRH